MVLIPGCTDRCCSQHCAATYSGRQVVTGGLDSPHSVLLLDLEAGEQTELADLLFPAAGHSCGVARHPATGHQDSYRSQSEVSGLQGGTGCW